MSELCGIELRFFTAPWSLQGAQMKRIFDEVTHDIELHLLHDFPELAGIPFHSDVNVDDVSRETETHGIKKIPTIQLSIQGHILLTLIGARPKLALRSELFTALETHSKHCCATKE